jgi:hypothetical protein
MIDEAPPGCTSTSPGRIQTARPLLSACGGPRELCATIEGTLSEASMNSVLNPTCLGGPNTNRQVFCSHVHFAGIQRSGTRPLFATNGPGGRIVTAGRAGGLSRQKVRSIPPSNTRIRAMSHFRFMAFHCAFRPAPFSGATGSVPVDIILKLSCSRRNSWLLRHAPAAWPESVTRF